MSDTSIPAKSEELWFEDGDIVLSAETDGIEHQFLVHRAILTIHSPVFRDMLSMPQPSGGESLAVPLIGDSVQDITAFLNELYIGRRAQTLNFDVALGILRLSHKYQIEGLQDRMKQKLMEDWPLDHSDYLLRLKFLKSPGYRIFPASQLIKTAQHCDIKELLPTAFYELACAWGTRCEEIVGCLSPENVTRLCVGRTRSERRLRRLSNLNSETSTPMGPGSNIDPSIIKHCEKFPRCKYGHPMFGHPNPSSFCLSAPSMFRIAVGKRTFDGVFALTALQEVLENGDFGVGICDGCRNWFMEVLKIKTRELWECIPADFDLPAVNPPSQIKYSLNACKCCGAWT